MNRAIVLDASRITDKDDMYLYFHSLFGPDFNAENLDALHDALSEVNEDAVFLLTQSNVSKICLDSYAYRILLVIGKAVEENPHLHIQFTK